MKVVLISGKAGHGKDTFAGYFKAYAESKGERCLVTHYADLLKYVCKTFFGWNGEKDEAGRSLLQYVGTDVVRAKDPDMWVNFVAKILTLFPDKWDWVLVPDARFPNEISIMKSQFDCTHVRVVRNGLETALTEEQQSHPSETALDGEVPDYYVENFDGFPDLLRNAAETIYRHMTGGAIRDEKL